MKKQNPPPQTALEMKQAKERVLVEVGKALIFCQVAEKQLELCVHHIFQDYSRPAVEILRDMSRKHTLGPLIEKLGKRAKLHPDFEALLAEFLENRNKLVHELIRLPEFYLETESGRESGMKFVMTVTAQARAITDVTSVHAKQFRIELGLERPTAGEEALITNDRNA